MYFLKKKTSGVCPTNDHENNFRLEEANRMKMMECTLGETKKKIYGTVWFTHIVSS